MKIQKQKKISFKKRVYQEIKSSWWVIAFVFTLYCFGSGSFDFKNEEILKLKDQVSFLEKQKAVAFEHKEDLFLQIESLKDPAWVEIMLMKKLGVVPEGQLKVRFKKEESEMPLYFEGM